MSDDYQAKISAARRLYRQANLELTWVGEDTPPQERIPALRLASETARALETLLESNNLLPRHDKELHGQMLMMRGFLQALGPMKSYVKPAAPETLRRISDQVCSVGAYSPI